MAEEITDTAERILKAAEDEFLEKGYGNAKMMSIAERAGVSQRRLRMCSSTLRSRTGKTGIVVGSVKPLERRL